MWFGEEALPVLTGKNSGCHTSFLLNGSLSFSLENALLHSSNMLETQRGTLKITSALKFVVRIQ